MRDRADTHLILALLAVLGLGSCERAGLPAASAAASSTAPAPVLEGRLEEAVWWAHLGHDSAVAACIGPEILDGSGTRVRMWTLTCVLLGSTEPLSCLQGAASSLTAEPIRLEGGSFLVELRPKEHRTWGEVRSKDELQVVVEGFF